MKKSTAVLHGNQLTLDGDGFSRIYRLDAGRITPVSTCSRTGEWQIVPVQEPPIRAAGADWRLAVTAVTDGLEAVLTDAGKEQYHFRLYHGVPGVTVRCFDGETAPASPPAPPPASGIEQEPVTAAHLPLETEWLALRERHVKIFAVRLADRTDQCDHLCRVDEYHAYCNEQLRLRGCLWAAEDPVTHAGLLWLKHAPLPESRPEPETWDLEVTLQEQPDGFGCCIRLRDGGYPVAVLAYENGFDGMTRILQRYLRKRVPYRAGLDGLIVSNTWGDRNRDMALNEAFMLREIDCAADMGVEICQIDDGWQAGVSANSGLAQANGGGRWGAHFHDGDEPFWAVNHSRFPRGFETLCERCRSRNVGLGLWFSPDGAEEFRHWREDSEQLLKLYRDYQIHWFKIDGIQMSSRLGMERLEAFFRQTSENAAEGVAFDLDVTADKRPGYFGLDQPGAIFVENRYTDTRSWLPSATFRNLWTLARFLPPERLRMEILNPERNQARYQGDLLAPAQYGMDWIFCSIMPASPLFWCELHQLPEVRKQELRPLIALWKKFRHELHGGTVYPIGETPDGFSWSGYYICGQDFQHLIVLRDHATSGFGTFRLPEPCGRVWQKIAGTGTISIEKSGRVSIRLPDMCSYVWFRSGGAANSAESEQLNQRQIRLAGNSSEGQSANQSS